MTKVAVVTGAAGGLGRAFVDRLLADGLTVVGVDIDGAALLAMAADREGFVAEAVDLTDAEAIADLFDRLTARFGGVDALVNNAGTCFMSDFPDIPAAELDRQMAINFSSAFHCCQGAVKAMAGRPGVRKIVNISSNGAYNFDVFDPPHYRASKAAMDTLTKDLARRYAREKIAVNSIAPGDDRDAAFQRADRGGAGAGDQRHAAWPGDAARRDRELGRLPDLGCRGCIVGERDHPEPGARRAVR